VIVRYLDVFRTRDRPPETHAIPVVHPNAALPTSVASEFFEPVAGRNAQIVQRSGDLKLPDLASRNRLDVHESPHAFPSGESFGIPVFE
jgi:hypothetical protein